MDESTEDRILLFQESVINQVLEQIHLLKESVNDLENHIFEAGGLLYQSRQSITILLNDCDIITHWLTQERN